MNEIDLDKLQRSVKACAKFPDRDCKGCEYKHKFICFHDELMDDFDRCIAMLKEQESLLKKSYELLADMGLDIFCDDLMCDDGWCEEHCGKSGKIGATPECAERWMLKQISEGR